jgi:hypothetical protein
MRQNRKNRLAMRTLNAPNRQIIESNPCIMRVPGQGKSHGAILSMFQLKANGDDKGNDKLDKGLAVSDKMQVSLLVFKVYGDCPVMPELLSPFLQICLRIVVIVIL